MEFKRLLKQSSILNEKPTQQVILVHNKMYIFSFTRIDELNQIRKV